jgi:two-component system, chemotaxis family, protein-glutamate methylesterase/glutaminase
MTETAGTNSIIVVGASAGGVPALTRLTSMLDPSLDVPMLVVLHLSPHHNTMLASVLQSRSRWKVTEARDGTTLRPGHIYTAVPDRHLMVDGSTIRITRAPVENRVRPSIDVLFRSAAHDYGPNAIGIVLSGSLGDGTSGLWSIVDRGGLAIAQSPNEAQFTEMPTTAVMNVDGVESLEIAAMQGRIERFLKRKNGAEVRDRNERLEIENQIARGENAMKAGSLRLGRPSPYTCPDCHGAMVEIVEDSALRFRCHTGHAHSAMSLLASGIESIDRQLWDAMRAMEERTLLLRRLEHGSRDSADPSHASHFAARAEEAERCAIAIRKLVQDPTILGHNERSGDSEGAPA